MLQYGKQSKSKVKHTNNYTNKHKNKNTKTDPKTTDYQHVADQRKKPAEARLYWAC
jgi:hypothetical protein